MKHEIKADPVRVLNESPDEFQRLLDQWQSALNPRSIVEQSLIERAAWSTFRFQCQVTAERARQAMKARHAAGAFDLGQHQRAFELGRSLVEGATPWLIVLELESFKQGVEWLVDRFRELEFLLETQGFWNSLDEFLVVKLLGKRHEDAPRDPSVAKIVIACEAVHPKAWPLAVGFHDLRIHERMLPSEAAVFLMALIRSQIERLGALKRNQVDKIDQLDQADVVARSFLDEEREIEREPRRWIDQLWKLRRLLNDPTFSNLASGGCQPAVLSNQKDNEGIKAEDRGLTPPACLNHGHPARAAKHVARIEPNLKKADPEVGRRGNSLPLAKVLHGKSKVINPQSNDPDKTERR